MAMNEPSATRLTVSHRTSFLRAENREVGRAEPRSVREASRVIDRPVVEPGVDVPAGDD
jgi:hypothetical protein